MALGDRFDTLGVMGIPLLVGPAIDAVIG